jgi:hypothetical protein
MSLAALDPPGLTSFSRVVVEPPSELNADPAQKWLIPIPLVGMTADVHEIEVMLVVLPVWKV